MAWLNGDGLYIKYGTEESQVNGVANVGNAGELLVAGGGDGRHCVEVVLNPLASLTTTGQIVSDTVTIPSGARLENIIVIAETAATSSGSGTLDLGLIDQDRASAYDDDGLIAAMALTAIDAAGETTTVVPGGTAAGALLGTTLTNTGLIVASYNTGAYQTGKLRIRIHYYYPST